MKLRKGELYPVQTDICAPFCVMKKETFRHGHVYVVQRYDKEWESAVLTAENILWVFCGREKIDAASEEFQQIPYIHIALDSLKEIAEFMNDVQEILMRLMNGNGRFMI